MTQCPVCGREIPNGGRCPMWRTESPIANWHYRHTRLATESDDGATTITKRNRPIGQRMAEGFGLIAKSGDG